MDALSEALKSVRTSGAIYYHAECINPWEVQLTMRNDDIGHAYSETFAWRCVNYFRSCEPPAALQQCIPGLPLQGITAERQIQAQDSASNVFSGDAISSDRLKIAGYERISFERFDTNVCTGRSLDDAIKFAMALGISATLKQRSS